MVQGPRALFSIIRSPEHVAQGELLGSLDVVHCQQLLQRKSSPKLLARFFTKLGRNVVPVHQMCRALKGPYCKFMISSTQDFWYLDNRPVARAQTSLCKCTVSTRAFFSGHTKSMVLGSDLKYDL